MPKLNGYKPTPFVDIRGKVDGFLIGKLTGKRREQDQMGTFYGMYLEDTDFPTTLKVDTGKYDPVDVHQGDEISFLANARLDQDLQSAKSSTPKVRIVYKGMGQKKPGRSAPHLFDAEELA